MQGVARGAVDSAVDRAVLFGARHSVVVDADDRHRSALSDSIICGNVTGSVEGKIDVSCACHTVELSTELQPPREASECLLDDLSTSPAVKHSNRGPAPMSDLDVSLEVCTRWARLRLPRVLLRAQCRHILKKGRHLFPWAAGAQYPPVQQLLLDTSTSWGRPQRKWGHGSCLPRWARGSTTVRLTVMPYHRSSREELYGTRSMSFFQRTC